MSRFRPLHVIKQTNPKHSGTVIFYHGSGDTGKGIKDWIKFLLKDDLQFPHLQVIYPTAELRPYTPLDGAKSNVWFDRTSITPDVPDHKESVDAVCNDMVQLIKNEISNDIPLNRIVIGGFSMGGGLSLQLAYRFLPEIAGVFTLSSFLSYNSLIYDELKQASSDDTRTQIPLFMCHGERDDLVSIEWGRSTYRNLVDLGVKAEFHPVKNAYHELKKEELKRLQSWILKVLPPLPTD